LHLWSSGRMSRCHRDGPGSIPGRCKFASEWRWDLSRGFGLLNVLGTKSPRGHLDLPLSHVYVLLYTSGTYPERPLGSRSPTNRYPLIQARKNKHSWITHLSAHIPTTASRTLADQTPMESMAHLCRDRIEHGTSRSSVWGSPTEPYLGNSKQ
jgi:hypothetical protein